MLLTVCEDESGKGLYNMSLVCLLVLRAISLAGLQGSQKVK